MNRRDLLVSMTGCAAYPACAGFFKPSNMAEKAIFKGDAPKKLWKWSRECYNYEKKGDKTECLTCPNHCELSPGDRSACRVKVNIDGTAYTLAYGNPCSMNVDPVEKKPLFHFHPGTVAFSIATAGCNLRCLNCQNWEISQKKPEEVVSRDLFPEDVVKTALQYNCKAIAYTYAEPTAFYEYMFDTAKIAHQHGIKNVCVTNGYISRAALEPLCPYIDGASVNLKAFSEEIYNDLNGCHLKPVLETLKTMKELNVWFEVITLLVPTYTDNMETVKGITGWILNNLGPDTPLHFSRFHPEHKLTQLPPTSIDILLKAQDYARSAGLRYVYAGNAPGLGRENTFCPKCKKVVVEREGFSIARMDVDAKGQCRFCGEKIAGRFA